MIKIKNALVYASDRLSELPISNPKLDSRLLLEFALDEPLSYILAHPDKPLSENQHKAFLQALARRMQLEPMAYIIGKKEFYGYEFIVNKHVLIPRPDTELLVDLALDVYCTDSKNCHPELDSGSKQPVEILNQVQDDNVSVSILELGVGSGCVIISLLLESSGISALGVDISDEALEVTKANAIIHKVKDRLDLIKSDWFENIALDCKFDIIISNPPYISDSDIEIMSRETILHEPHTALFAANEGLASYETIAQNAKNYLKPAGSLILEIGINQKDHIIELFAKHSYQLARIQKDLSGIDRALVFKSF
jgi:release factor glutamine methyltransferase